MLDAMNVWETAVGVRFVPWNNEDGHILVTDHETPNLGAYQGVGYYGDERKLSIGGEAWTRRVLLHELGHALGFWHTQSRADRDRYVRIETAHVLPDELDQFEQTEDTLTYGHYDFASIMHYRACAFSSCDACLSGDPACRTITVLPPYDSEWQRKIGTNEDLSSLDKLTISLLYAPSDWVFVDADSQNDPGAGTFFSRFRRFESGEEAVPVNGTLIVQPGTYSVGELHSKPMVIKAPLGGVVLTK